jgi:hypothetical protein
MGVQSRRPPLPAPTDLSSAVDEPSIAAGSGGTTVDTSDDLATDLSRRTDRTHYSIPEDGSPVTITTHKTHRKDKSGSKSHSQTSLLIEYYEGQDSGPTSRPSLRVRVTPSSKSKKHGTRDHIQISETTRTGKPSNIRRISIPASRGTDGDSISSLSEASSGRPPVEVDILHNASEISSDRFIVAPSDVSAMPESMLDGPTAAVVGLKSRSLGKEESYTRDTLKEPERRNSRSASRERLVQRVKEKVQADHHFRIKNSKESRRRGEGRSRSVSKELLGETGKSRSKYREDNRSEISAISSTESTASINNPKFLQAVEDAIKTLIPELNAVKEEQKLHVSKTRSRDENGRERRVSGERRLGKSSSIPSVRVSDEQDYEHDSSRRRSSRRSSRGSVSEQSRDISDHENSERKRHTSGGKLAGAALAGVALGVGAAALKHRSSRSSLEGKRRRSKGESRSRKSSLSEHMERADYDRETPTKHSRDIDFDESARDEHVSIPPMPMQSLLESDVTRDSILSADTERPYSHTSRTPVPEVKHVKRGTIQGSPLNSPVERSVSHEHVRDYPDDRSSSTAQPHFGTGAAVGLAGAAAAAAYALGHHGHDGPRTPTRDVSPVQSDDSYFYEREDYAQHPRVKTIKSNKSMSSERRRHRKPSPLSGTGSPVSQHARDRKREGISLESPYEILPEDEYQPETPNEEDFDEWLAKEHEKNELYREEIERESQIGTRDINRDAMYDDSPALSEHPHNLGRVGANAEYVHTPLAVESAVASLQEPSAISVRSSESSIRDRDLVSLPISQPESLTLVHSAGGGPHMYMDSKSRWEQIRDQAMALTHRQSLDQVNFESPAQSPTKDLHDEGPIMQSSYVPLPGDMPEIGVVPDDDSELLTNPSMLSGRLGEGIDMPSYEPSPNVNHSGPSHAKDIAALGAATGLGLLAGHEYSKHRQPTVEDEEDHAGPGFQSRDLPETDSPAHFHQNYQLPFISKDLYNPVVIDSPVPNPIPALGMEDDDYIDEGDDDVFTSQKHLRHESGLSHGMSTPLYDRATGKGMDRIQSRDIVYLMDHLTVRDGQRNARDTEILTTLVRSAAEMRINFEDMKRQLEEHDRVILHKVERSQEKVAQRVLNGPRPFPSSTGSQTPKGASEAGDLPGKRQNVFKRALRGLGARNSNDLVRIEDMLMRLLTEVETLKDAQIASKHALTRTASLNSYEHLRAAPDPLYEPEGRTATNSGSPGAHSAGYLSNSSSRLVNNTMHSGFDGLRSSERHNRISTVLEGDEDLDDDALGTSREVQPAYQSNQKNTDLDTPPHQTTRDFDAEQTPRTEKTKSRYKSGASSLFGGIPKISRWSKTTTSTVPESVRNSMFASGGSRKNIDRPPSLQSMSQHSMTESNPDLHGYEYDMDGNPLGSTGSLVGDHEGLDHAPDSPLVSGSQDQYSHELYDDDYELDEEDYEYDDPKYQAHRNSLNLQHPQPKHGPTDVHQNHLETQAMVYGIDNPPTPEADHWGSAPALALNRNRYVGSSKQQHPLQTEQKVSPVHSDDGEDEYHQLNQSSQQGYAGMYTMPPALMSSGMHIGSPLEPIEEVRRSLETDRHSISRDEDTTPEPTRAMIVGGRLHPGNANARGQRKPSGPRDMPRSPSGGSARRAEGSPGKFFVSDNNQLLIPSS